MKADSILAQEFLLEHEYALVAVKEGDIVFQSTKPGISELLRLSQDPIFPFENASVADKIVGRAAALLLTACKVRYVYAQTISKEGKSLLTQYEIPFDFGTETDIILGRNQKDMCIFEKRSLDAKNPEQAILLLQDLMDSLKTKSG